MLNHILDYAAREGFKSEPGFSRKTVRWAINCSDDARFTGLVSLSEGKKGRDFDFCPHLAQNEMIAGGVTRSQFLIESLQTIAQYWKDDTSEKDQQKYRAKQQYFIQLLKQAGEADPTLKVAARMLSDPEQQEKLRQDIAKASPKPKFIDTAIVMIEGDNPLKRDAWHDWWRQFRQQFSVPANNAKKTAKVRSLLTGEWVEPLATHPKIKGLAGVGGLGTGDVMIGFDKDAFGSFGLQKSANAATDTTTATTYAETLSQLIQQHGVRLSNNIATYWFEHRVADKQDPFKAVVKAEHEPRDLLELLHAGGKKKVPINNQYSALILSGAAGRVMVRDWIQGQLSELASTVLAWFEALEIIARDGNSLAKPPKFLAVMGALERDLSDVPSPLITQLWRSALVNTPIPQAALTKATLRARIDVIKDNPPNHAQMGLIKAYWIRQGDTYMQPYINPEHPSPAYQCGRLLAVLNCLQRSALGDVGAGVVQRYYGAASQTPALTFGKLMNNAKNHLNKLDGRLAYWYEGLLSEVMCQLKDVMPPKLELEEQSLFALGYYQQLAELKRKKTDEEKSAKSSNTKTTETAIA